jgi:molybdopterin converting factor small subunit
MQVHVQLFSILRDCLPPDAERGRATVSLPEGATLADLVRHLGIDRFLGYEVDKIVSQAGWQVMVSGSYEPNMGRMLRDGDEVLILPFASGGH